MASKRFLLIIIINNCKYTQLIYGGQHTNVWMNIWTRWIHHYVCSRGGTFLQDDYMVIVRKTNCHLINIKNVILFINVVLFITRHYQNYHIRVLVSIFLQNLLNFNHFDICILFKNRYNVLRLKVILILIMVTVSWTN